jgi:cytochrome c-type biogenesis protein CcmH
MTAVTSGRVARRRLGALGADALLVVLAVAAVTVTLVVLVTAGGRSSSDLPAQAHAVAATLRCPVCQDLSAADSPAPMAGQMRREILADLQRGRSPEQIRARFVAAYGPSVLLSPPRRGVGSVAYLLPLLAVGAAASAGAVVLRRWLRRPGAPAERADPVAEVTP